MQCSDRGRPVFTVTHGLLPPDPTPESYLESPGTRVKQLRNRKAAGHHFPRGVSSVESNNGGKPLTPPPQGAPGTLLSCEVTETHWVFSNCETQFSAC